MNILYFVLAVVAAFGFFWLRLKHRAVYGGFEIVVGLAILAVHYLVRGPVVLLADNAGSFLYGPLATLVSLFTGIYAIVRGLDNIHTWRTGQTK